MIFLRFPPPGLEHRIDILKNNLKANMVKHWFLDQRIKVKGKKKWDHIFDVKKVSRNISLARKNMKNEI